MTGKLLLALGTFGSWRDAHTTLAQVAAQVPQGVEHVDGSPEAIPQRLHQRALVFLQDLLPCW